MTVLAINAPFLGAGLNRMSGRVQLELDYSELKLKGFRGTPTDLLKS